MKKGNLLIIDKHPFGRLVDVYKWCIYLRDDYDITLICFDSGDEHPEIEGVEVRYVSWAGSIVIRGLRYILCCLWAIMFFKGKILVEYFEHCDVLKRFFPNKRMLLDVRTLSISPDVDKRKMSDKALVASCKLYDAISVISASVKHKIGEVGRPVYILPLGADCISRVPKVYNSMRLLYVGTFTGRDLDKTIRGLSLFCGRFPGADIHYDIIGSGNHREDEFLLGLVTKLDMQSKVTFHGRVPNNRLAPYFDRVNIGVSFVPITEYYNCQPPTKTFEYILSGLFTIATATDENKKIISEANGLLIDDTEAAFADALESIYTRKVVMREKAVRESLSGVTWSEIVDVHLKQILDKF